MTWRCLLTVLLLSITTCSRALAVPPAPASCAATIVVTAADKGVQLTWVPVAGVSGYTVYRNGTLVAVVGPGTLTLLDREYPVRGDARYCVDAFDGTGNSPQTCTLASSTLITAARVDGPDWYQDTFPWNEVVTPGTSEFDTAATHIGSGRNVAPLTGNVARFDVPQGWARLTPGLAVTRVDLIFRIKPGPGNYHDLGVPASGLRTWPTNPNLLIAPGDGSFWSTYIAYNGLYGTGSPGTGGTPHNPNAPWPQRWDPSTWNSAQCALVNGFYITNQFAAPNVKIIPDGLLPGGGHVEYFFRVQTGAGVILLPDTNFVLQVDGERSIDGHRWAQFNVLPDLWKKSEYGGPGLAQTLVIDLCDGHGAERLWTGFADSTGASSSSKYSAGNGWHALGGKDVNVDDPLMNRLQDNLTPGFERFNYGAPGTRWDLFNVRGPDDLLDGQAGSIGSRLAPRPGAGPLFGAESHQGPTPDMLRTYYRQILIFTADRHEGILGPFVNRGQDDLAILRDFLDNPAGSLQPRGLYIEGEGFVESESNPALPPEHGAFLWGHLATELRHPDFRLLSGATDVAKLSTVAPHVAAEFQCALNGDPDVLIANPAFPGAVAAAYWENIGPNGPYVASVYKPATLVHNNVTLVDGWNAARLGVERGFICPGCSSPQRDQSPGLRAARTESVSSRMLYYDETFDNLFGSVAQLTDPGPPLGVPHSPPLAMGLTIAGNPVHEGAARIRFGLSSSSQVRIEIFDTAGRRVRSLTDRQYGAGTWEVEWNGTDESGQRVATGVYFARMHQNAMDAEGSARLVFIR